MWKNSWKRPSISVSAALSSRVSLCDHCLHTETVVEYRAWTSTYQKKKDSSRHLSLLYLQRRLLPLHLVSRFTSAFPAVFVFTRSAATVSLSFPSPLSTSILSKPLAGAFNRQWHLSPRAVMSPIHQQWMTDCTPPPPTHIFLSLTEPGGKGSHATKPEQLDSVRVVRADTHGHRIWTLNHWCLMCAPFPLLHSHSPYTALPAHPQRSEARWQRGRRECRGHTGLSFWGMIPIRALWHPLIQWLMQPVSRTPFRYLSEHYCKSMHPKTIKHHMWDLNVK